MRLFQYSKDEKGSEARDERVRVSKNPLDGLFFKTNRISRPMQIPRLN